MTAFQAAVQRRQWDLVALYLLLAVSETARALPPESLEALISLLADEDDEERR